MAPVRHRWSISDVIVEIRNTVMPSDCSALRFGIRSVVSLLHGIRWKHQLEFFRLKLPLSNVIKSAYRASKSEYGSRAVASRSKASRLGLVLRNARWFESSWGKKFSHEISASVWDRCPPSIVMHLGSYDRHVRHSTYPENMPATPFSEYHVFPDTVDQFCCMGTSIIVQ
ncbi:hypothetical protein ANN_23747 [Periplaneta americana]|uniref:Uncharacterized protein n=1 Tax=Periplaneta americana TaxID=6978 RepID=A0ABQ8SN65_PERAM|nr:hypothetical protein ANN_23747 [Periplaneta americana]